MSHWLRHAKARLARTFQSPSKDTLLAGRFYRSFYVPSPPHNRYYQFLRCGPPQTRDIPQEPPRVNPRDCKNPQPTISPRAHSDYYWHPIRPPRHLALNRWHMTDSMARSEEHTSELQSR